MKRILSLKPPVQEKPTTLSFDVRPTAVDAWVGSLPMGHVGEATRQVFSALRETNALEIEGKLRFGLLEAVAPSVESITGALRRHFDHNQFPLPLKSLQVAKLSSELLQEMAIAYRMVLDSDISASWFTRRNQRKTWMVANHRLLHFLGELLWNFRLLNTPAPKGAWHEVHRTYEHAHHNGWHQEPVQRASDESWHDTIEELYKETLLLQLIPIQHLRKPQMLELRRSIKYWADLVNLLDDNGAPTQAAFCIFPESDNAALPENEASRKLRGKGMRRRLIENGALGQELARHLNVAVKAHGKAELAHGIIMSEDTLHELLLAWIEPPMRCEPRQPMPTSGVELSLGLTALHDILAGWGGEKEPEEETSPALEQPPTAETGFEMSLPLSEKDVEKPKLELGTGGAFVSHTEEEQDAWGHVYPSADTHTKKAWVDNVQQREYRPFAGAIIDHSQHGFRVSVPTEEVERIRVGEVIGVHTEEQWVAGSVRWIRHVQDNELQLGIRRHIEDTIPIELYVSVDQDKESAPLRCLLGTQEDGSVVVFLPTLPGLREKRLVAHYDGKNIDVALKKKVAASPAFEAFVAQFKGYATPSMPPLLRAHLPDAPEQAGKANKSTPLDDEFSSIWSTL